MKRQHRAPFFLFLVFMVFILTALFLYAQPQRGHFVVAGGAHTKAQVTSAKLHNKAARALWGPVDFTKLVATKTTHAMFAYDSYRVGNKIYWTKRPRFIPAGEPIWSDGTYAILMRCGNLIALDPQLPTLAEHEPQDLYPPDRFYPEPDAPEVAYQPVGDLSSPIPNLTAPPTDSTPMPAVSYPPAFFTPGGSPPTPTPEPSTVVLLGFGTLVLLLLTVILKYT